MITKTHSPADCDAIFCDKMGNFVIQLSRIYRTILAVLLVISLGAFDLAHLEGRDPGKQVHPSIKINFTFAV